MSKKPDPYASEEDTLSLIGRDERTPAEKKLDQMMEDRGAWEQGAEPFLILRQIAAELLAEQAEQAQPVADASAWFALVMCAAAELEDASNCLRDADARGVAIRGAKYYRDAANALYTAPPRQPEQEPVEAKRLRRGNLLRCIETDELCTVWFTSTTGKTLVKWSANDFGEYTAEQIGELFWLVPEPDDLELAAEKSDNYAAFHAGYRFAMAHNAPPPRKPLTDEQEREAFEAWCYSVGLMQKSYGILSINSQTETAWLAWKARAAHNITKENT
jgi:hypothetical protein